MSAKYGTKKLKRPRDPRYLQGRANPSTKGGFEETNLGADITAEEVAFGRAMQARQRATGAVSLSPREVLAVAREMGYRKVTG